MLKRREFLTSMCGLGVAALAPWALLAESPVKWRRIENIIPDNTPVHFRFENSDGAWTDGFVSYGMFLKTIPAHQDYRLVLLEWR